MNTFSPLQKMLMSVVMEHMIAPKHVQTLLQAILVDVILDIYCILMELLVHKK